MNKLFIIIMLVVFAVPVFAADSELPVDGKGIRMQTFAPAPAKSQTNASMTGTVIFKKGTGATVNVTGWLFIKVDPTADSTYYFNSDSGKTYPLRAGSDNLIPLASLAVGESVSLVLGAATASIQGM